MVFVLNIKGEPLMPCKPAKARKLLRDDKAKIVKYTPFTIQLKFEVEDGVQDITLGVDAGSKNIGLSATTKDKELYSSEVELRNDISRKLSTRKRQRRARRSRLRYREVRFDNRVKRKKKGWLAPSVEHKIQTHMTVIGDVHEILPISKIIVETASFDMQRIENPNIKGKEYQQGEQLGFTNIRQYVLHRDEYKCQQCKGKSKDERLQVHHIIHRSRGGTNTPNNLLTLCSTCHKEYHDGNTELKITKPRTYQHSAFMNIMRKTLLNRLEEVYPNVEETHGYITKNTREKFNLPKSHRVDARCISGNPTAEPSGKWYLQKKVRRNNRQVHQPKIYKGGKKRSNQTPHLTHEFRLHDKVEYQGSMYFIIGRRKTGIFKVRDLRGNKPNKSGDITYRKLKYREYSKGILKEAVED